MSRSSIRQTSWLFSSIAAIKAFCLAFAAWQGARRQQLHIRRKDQHVAYSSRQPLARTALTFADDGWSDDVGETCQTLPPPLRVSVDLTNDTEQSA